MRGARIAGATATMMRQSYVLSPSTTCKDKIRVRGFPERDILSLRTLGLGLDRFGEFFRRRIFVSELVIACNSYLIRVRGFPKRDILSLRTLGLGLDRFGASFRRRFSKVGNPRI